VSRWPSLIALTNIEMNASSAPATGTGSMVVKIVLLIVGAFAIYYSYKFLFAASKQSVVLIPDIYKANVDKAYEFPRAVMPPLYEGGEYSISMWIYVNNWTGARNNYNKEVICIGNRSGEGNGKVTLGVYLDAIENTIHVRTSSVADCSGAPAAATTVASSPASTGSNSCLRFSSYKALFTNPNVGANMLTTNSAGDCSVSGFEMQKWVQLTVVLNGKTTDVYMDGKLARSCVNNGIYAVDSQDFTTTVVGSGGFGGFISGVQLYDYALNPEEIYKSYMAGPLSGVSLGDYVKSFFDPKSIGTLEYPKMNQ
jgi:hypothetical protein